MVTQISLSCHATPDDPTSGSAACHHGLPSGFIAHAHRSTCQCLSRFRWQRLGKEDYFSLQYCSTPARVTADSEVVLCYCSGWVRSACHRWSCLRQQAPTWHRRSRSRNEFQKKTRSFLSRVHSARTIQPVRRPYLRAPTTSSVKWNPKPKPQSGKHALLLFTWEQVQVCAVYMLSEYMASSVPLDRGTAMPLCMHQALIGTLSVIASDHDCILLLYYLKTSDATWKQNEQSASHLGLKHRLIYYLCKSYSSVYW